MNMGEDKMLMEKWVKHFDDQSDLLTRLITFIDISSCCLLKVTKEREVVKKWWKACDSQSIQLKFSRQTIRNFLFMKSP